MSRRRIRPGAAIAAVVVSAAMVKFLVLDAVVVEGRSMLPRLKPGSVVLVLRCAYGLKNPFGSGYLVRWSSPQLGDVVASPNPREGRTVLKRVVAVGPVRLSIAADSLVGPLIDAPLGPERSRELGDSLFVPPAAVFLLGDNISESVDSRDYGPVSIDLIFGRALVSRHRTAP